MRFATIQALCLMGALSITCGQAGAKGVVDEGPAGLRILGWAERVYLVEPGIELKAKLDTGAQTSSLDARIIKKFRQYGKRWVRFAVRDVNSGREAVLVRERERTIGIVQRGGENDVRPTVKVEFCVAGETREIEVSLTDRSRFEYPMLLGRRALEGFALVDSGHAYVSDPDCASPGGAESSMARPGSHKTISSVRRPFSDWNEGVANLQTRPRGALA